MKDMIVHVSQLVDLQQIRRGRPLTKELRRFLTEDEKANPILLNAHNRRPNLFFLEGSDENVNKFWVRFNAGHTYLHARLVEEETKRLRTWATEEDMPPRDGPTYSEPEEEDYDPYVPEEPDP